MKILILILSLFSLQAQSIELVLNGVTYNIKKYEISNNGQRIVIKHPTIKNNHVAHRCSNSSKKAASYTQKKYIKYKPSIKRRPSAFERLWKEFDTKKDNKLRYQ